MKKTRGIIYKITNLINGKQYVGQTIQEPKLRFRAHCAKSRKSAINSAIQKYGRKNFKFEILCSAKSIEDLNVLEVGFISTFNTMSPNGSNLDIGGRNCAKSKESIEKGAKKKRGMAYKGRRRGIIATHSETGRVIETEVVKDFLKYGFSKNDLSNIRWVLTGKSSKKRVKKYFFRYKLDANQSLIVERKKTTAAQRIVDEPVRCTE